MADDKDLLKQVAQRGRPKKTKRSTKKLVAETLHDLKNTVAVFDGFDIGLGQSAASTEIRINGMWLMMMLSKVLTPKGHLIRPNPKQQERLGRLLMATGCAKPYRDVPRGQSRQEQQQEALEAKLADLAAKLDSVPKTKVIEQHWYSVEDFTKAARLKSMWMVRDYCRRRMLRSKKYDPDNPKSPWVVHYTEIERMLKEAIPTAVVDQPEREEA